MKRRLETSLHFIDGPPNTDFLHDWTADAAWKHQQSTFHPFKQEEPQQVQSDTETRRHGYGRRSR